MNRVTIELWLWLGEELKEGFASLSAMRSVREELVEDGTTIKELLSSLARHYAPIEKRVFKLKEGKLYPDMVAKYNEGIVDWQVIGAQVLRDGDKITIMPLYTGG